VALFAHLRIHGTDASILWGYRPAAELRAWSIARINGQWTLIGSLKRSDAYMCRQKGLLFTAPREGAHDGFWAWAVLSVEVVNLQLRARLGPPEQ
jgi:hypothetical protein